MLRSTQSVAQAVSAKANESAVLDGVFSSFAANTPLLQVSVDRARAKAMGIPLDGLYGTLQVFLGSQYVNDFTFANRTYRVYVQADGQFRDEPRAFFNAFLQYNADTRQVSSNLRFNLT